MAIVAVSWEDVLVIAWRPFLLLLLPFFFSFNCGLVKFGLLHCLHVTYMRHHSIAALVFIVYFTGKILQLFVKLESHERVMIPCRSLETSEHS